MPKSQFYTATSTLEKLSESCYFRNKDGKFEWPALFQEIADGCQPKPEYELALRALGACHWYLKDSELDIQVFSLAKFEKYHSLDLNTKNKSIAQDYMVLDSTTIRNLDLLGGKGSLQKTLDHCQTAFGKRYIFLFYSYQCTLNIF